MLRNYGKVALRNLWRNKTFSAINIAGLALGLAASLLIFGWVGYERSYDAFHADGRNLYHVLLTQRYDNGQESTSIATPGRLAEALKREFPGVAQAVLVMDDEKLLLRVGNRSYRETGAYAGPDFFGVFSFRLLQGDARTVLTAPYTAVISRKLARKYFGNGSAVGKSIRVDNREVYQVTGVFADVPANSSLQFDFLLSHKTIERQFPVMANDWNAIGPRTFVRLRDDAPVARISAALKDHLKDKQTEYNSTLSLQRFRDAHLHSHFSNGLPDGGRITYVRLFLGAALFILVIACINFVNLSTAKAARRAREVGIRKAAGASRPALVGQFMAEALLLVVLSFGLALLLAALVLPLFNALTGQPLRPQLGAGTFLLLTGLLAATGLAAGTYPAFFLASFQPVQVLKGTLRVGPLAARLRKGLVTFQFAVSCVLIAGTLVVYLQTRYIGQKHLGFDRADVVYACMEGDLPKNFRAFKNELQASPAIRSVTTAGQAPLHVTHTITSVEWPGKGAGQKISFSFWGVNHGFVKALGLQLEEGRDFSPDFGTDSLNVLINEAAAAVMGLAHPVGQPVTVERSFTARGKIIGVVKNFHLASLHTPIQPLILFLNTDPDWGYVILKTAPGRTADALAALREAHRRYNPAFPLEYEFADQEYGKLYRDEATAGRLAACFAGLAIFISCLGLFGLAAFTAGQRTKEIGIRKVLGAPVGGLVVLLSRDFLRPVGWAIVVATPVAWYVARGWLQDFAYKIDLSWWPFAVAGGLSVVIALLTVGYQSLKAAAANPVQSLRSE